MTDERIILPSELEIVGRVAWMRNSTDALPSVNPDAAHLERLLCDEIAGKKVPSGELASFVTNGAIKATAAYAAAHNVPEGLGVQLLRTQIARLLDSIFEGNPNLMAIRLAWNAFITTKGS